MASVLQSKRAGKLVVTIQKRHVTNHAVKKVCKAFLQRLEDASAIDAQLSSIRDRLPKAMLNMVLAGALFRKMCRSAAPRTRLVTVSADCQYLVWEDPKRNGSPKTMALCNLSEVRPGACTFELKRKPLGSRQAAPECSLALFDRHKPDWTLSLEAETPEICRRWVSALELLQQLNDARGAREAFESSN